MWLKSLLRNASRQFLYCCILLKTLRPKTFSPFSITLYFEILTFISYRTKKIPLPFLFNSGLTLDPICYSCHDIWAYLFAAAPWLWRTLPPRNTEAPDQESPLKWKSNVNLSQTSSFQEVSALNFSCMPMGPWAKKNRPLNYRSWSSVLKISQEY